MTLPLADFVPVWGLLAMNITSPGPNVLNTMATAIGSGRRAGIGSALAVGVGLGLWCLGMTLGIATLFRLWPPTRTIMPCVSRGLRLSFAGHYLQKSRRQLRYPSVLSLAGSAGESGACH